MGIIDSIQDVLKDWYKEHGKPYKGILCLTDDVVTELQKTSYYECELQGDYLFGCKVIVRTDEELGWWLWNLQAGIKIIHSFKNLLI